MYRIRNLVDRNGLDTEPVRLTFKEYLLTSDTVDIHIFATGCHSVRGLDDVSSRFPCSDFISQLLWQLNTRMENEPDSSRGIPLAEQARTNSCVSPSTSNNILQGWTCFGIDSIWQQLTTRSSWKIQESYR